MLGALLGVGSSLLGGILNRNSAKKQQAQAQQFAQENSVIDFDRLVKQSTAAGFNPLTALMGGGATPAAGNVQNTFNPALSSGSFIAEAIDRGANTYFNDVAAKDAEAIRVQENEESKRRWEAEMANRSSQSFGYALTDQRAYQPATRMTGPRVGPGAVEGFNPGGASPSDEAVNPSELPIMIGGREFRPRSGSSDAEAFETRYGEIGAEGFGLGNLVWDAGKAARGAFDTHLGRQRDKKKRPPINPRRGGVPDGYGGVYR